MREPRITEEQRRMLNAACGDLATQVRWHGFRMSKDDWRHFLCGTVMGWRMVPGYDRGQGAPGFVMLGGSSLKLTKAQAAEAIDMAFHIGDHPSDQGLHSPPVDWCMVIKLSRGILIEDPA